jgi:hypothetical protein
MKLTFVRPVRETDAPKFIEWSKENPAFDPKVALYPSTMNYAAFKKNKIVLYAPVQKPLFIEALAINPEASEMEIASAMCEITQEAVSKAYREGSGEIYFLGTNEDTIVYASKCFEEVPYRLFRLRISNIEGQNEQVQDQQNSLAVGETS